MIRRLLPVAGLCLLSPCAAQAPRKYVEFFANQSASLDDGASAVIAEVADKARKHPSRIVKVEGYAAAGSNLSADALLAIDRAKAVTAKLFEDGVRGDRIIQTPRAPSNAEGMEVGARRVEIEITRP